MAGSRTADRPAATRRRRLTPRRVVLGAVVLVALGVTYYLANLVAVWWVGRSDQARAVDAIVVLGAAQYDGRPSPQLAARLDHALDLYERGLAPYVVVTGGQQPADRFTEATASANYLMARGVPDASILREVQGRSSWESLAAAARILRERGLTRVLLVSDPYHSLRIRGIARELGLTAFVSPTRTSPVKGMAAFRYMVREAGGASMARIIGWRRVLNLPSG